MRTILSSWYWVCYQGFFLSLDLFYYLLSLISFKQEYRYESHWLVPSISISMKDNFQIIIYTLSLFVCFYLPYSTLSKFFNLRLITVWMQNYVFLASFRWNLIINRINRITICSKNIQRGYCNRIFKKPSQNLHMHVFNERIENKIWILHKDIVCWSCQGSFL